MQYDHTISRLLRKRDEMMGEMQAHREAMAALHNDVEAIDRVLQAMGYVGDLEARTGRPNRLVIFYRNELRRHLGDFLNAYNFARRLKTLSGLTPYEYICKIWTNEPQRFTGDPLHQMPGLNT